MKNKKARQLIKEAPDYQKIYVKKYVQIVTLVNRILKEKGYTQKTLAKKLGKQPSEISKWLNGEHNFTLKSLAKLEAELGEPIIFIPEIKKQTSVKTT